jgi:hypothetical protein
LFFNIVCKKHATVAEVFNTTPLINVSFMRPLIGNKLLEWNNLIATIVNINLQAGKDTITWTLSKSGTFTVKSMYKYLINNDIKVTQEIWHVKLPLKIKIFLWFLKRA